MALLWETRRRRATKSLMEYVRVTTPGYIVSKHLIEIAEHLEAVERGEIDRLIIVEPPRHGKSLLASQRFPAWFLGRNPKDELIHVSHGGKLASTFGMNLRNMMSAPAHQTIFPGCILSPDSKAKDLFHTLAGGVYCAAGIGGAITGRGMHLGLIDDPIKSREDADSETYRRKNWEWYQNDFYTRLMPGGRIVVIQTRWHDDDLAGRLLAEGAEGGDQWTILHHPAVNDAGAALWPSQFDMGYLDRARRNAGERAWNSLYQGNPTPESGTYFQKDTIQYDTPPPEDEMRYYASSDYAVTDGDGDWTVHLVIGIDTDSRLWVMDLWRGQTTSDLWIPPMLEMMKRWAPIAWATEKGHIEKSIGPFLAQQMLKQKVYCRMMPFASTRDKATRARSIQAKISMSGLWLPKARTWTGELVSEMLKFPRGKHDDQVDCLSLIGRMLAGLQDGDVPKEDAEPPDFTQPNPYHLTIDDIGGKFP